MINLKNDRELFVDDYILDTRLTTAEKRLHHPVRRDVVLRHDEEWEGNCCDYHNFFYDDGVWRMYYLGWWFGYGRQMDVKLCYAESTDGIHWTKPNLGICEYNGSKNNNILIDKKAFGHVIDNFMVFRDDNPACLPEEKYKAVAKRYVPKDECSEATDEKKDTIRVLYSYVSPDGIHFTKKEQICADGAYDSLNVAFWDARSGKYRAYYRSAHHPGETESIPFFTENDVRDIRYIESEDFIHWSESRILDFKDAEDVALYTNVVQPYYRAPQILVGFPSRYICRKSWTPNYDELCGKEGRLERMKKESRLGLAVTDCVFMSSRNGYTFDRPDEAFIRPEPEEPYGWVYGTAYPARGMIETPSRMPGADNEISMYLFENHFSDKSADLTRYTIRLDGFVSMHAGGRERVVVTKPFTFDGDELRINFATSARGYLYITVTAEDGTVLESCETFGNRTDRTVHFNSDLSELKGKAVVMTVRMLDADLYSFRFL